MLKDTQQKKPKVLLIEDDIFLVKMYKEKFDMEGFQLLVAEDGEIGLKMALEEKVNLIILDLMIPKLPGIELLRKLRESDNGKNIPVIVLTNLAEKDKKQQAMELGAKEFLVKANLTPGELIKNVKGLLDFLK